MKKLTVVLINQPRDWKDTYILNTEFYGELSKLYNLNFKIRAWDSVSINPNRNETSNVNTEDFQNHWNACEVFNQHTFMREVWDNVNLNKENAAYRIDELFFNYDKFCRFFSSIASIKNITVPRGDVLIARHDVVFPKSAAIKIKSLLDRLEDNQVGVDYIDPNAQYLHFGDYWYGMSSNNFNRLSNNSFDTIYRLCISESNRLGNLEYIRQKMHYIHNQWLFAEGLQPISNGSQSLSGSEIYRNLKKTDG